MKVFIHFIQPDAEGVGRIQLDMTEFEAMDIDRVLKVSKNSEDEFVRLTNVDGIMCLIRRSNISHINIHTSKPIQATTQ